MPLLLTQQISDGGGPAPRWVLAQLFWGDCDAPDQVLGAGAGAEVWDASERWEWARLYLHFTHVTEQPRGPRAELGGFVPGHPWGHGAIPRPWGQLLEGSSASLAGLRFG